MFIGVKMHFAEIAPNSVAYTFWEDIIQPNNEVIEITKVNRVFLGLIIMRGHPKILHIFGLAESYNFKKKFYERKLLNNYQRTIFASFVNIKLLKVQ